MKKTLLILLVFALLLTSAPPSPLALPSPLAQPAMASDPFHGELHYRVRGPAAAPYGIGTALLVGAIGLPLAVIRVQNMLVTAMDVIAQLPTTTEHPSMQRVHEWAHEGIPVDISRILPIAGSYDARLTFTLQRTGTDRYELQSGNITWSASNRLNLSDGDVIIRDGFQGSGGQPLDPARDTITLRINRRDNPPTYELDVDVNHASTISGSSEIVLGPFGQIMSLDATGGNLTMGGLGFMLMEGGAIDLGPTPDGYVGYFRTGTMDQLRGTEIWRDLLDNAVLVHYNLYSQVRADAGGPYTFEMGVPLDLSGQRSEGAITDWTWTFAPGPGCTDGPPPHGDAEKTGETTTVTLLCDTQITLEVVDAQGNRDTDIVLATRVDRDWEIPFIGPHTREEADQNEGRLETATGGSILARAVGPPDNRTYDVSYTSGENVSYIPAPAGARDDLFIPPGSGDPRSWDDDGYTIGQVTDPGGPFDGMFYIESFDIRIHRRSLIHRMLLPADQGGRTALSGQRLFYDRNVAEGHDVGGYLEGIRAHEFEHSVEIRKAIEAHDPAPDIDAMYHTDRDALRQRADEALDAARLEVCIATSDPLPGGVTWRGTLTFPIDDHSGWVTGEGSAGEFPPQDRASREAGCR